MGSNPNATPELVDDSRPMELTKPIPGQTPDLNDQDITHLNIHENMNEGKSQTWIKYGAEIAEQYDLDYVVKCNMDTLLHLHKFFTWAYKNLPPAPYNNHVYVGGLLDKAFWRKKNNKPKDYARFESYFGKNYDDVHLYFAGQFYMMSTDLARFVGQEALANKCSYCEGHEDHDISSMAFHSPDPIHIMGLSHPQRFWQHPVKDEKRWKKFWDQESASMAGKPYEGKVFNTKSTFLDVMGYGPEFTKRE